MAMNRLSRGVLLTAVFTVPIVLLLYAVDFSFVRNFSRQKLNSTTQKERQAVSVPLVTPYKLPHTKHLNGTTPSVLSCLSDDSISFTKSFLYLMQTESCIPKNLLSPSVLGDPLACNLDILVLRF